MKKEKLQLIALAVLIGFGLLYAYYTYLLSPELGVIKQKTGQLAQRQEYYLRLHHYARNETGLEQDLKNLEQESKGLITQSVGHLDKPRIMVDLYALAKEQGVYPQTVAFAEPQVKSGYMELPVTFTSLGQPDNVLGMISALVTEKNSNLAVQAVSLTQQQGVLRAELKLTGFFSDDTPPADKPSFMNASFGVETPARMFQP